MPVYVFGCDACGLEQEVLRPLGDLVAPDCPACGGATRHKIARVAVRYDAFGFTSMDKLVADPATKDAKALRRKAEQIADDG